MARAEMGESPKCQKCEGLEAGDLDRRVNFFFGLESTFFGKTYRKVVVFLIFSIFS